MTGDATERRDDAQLLRIATAGSVDDGKSTLIGRLLHDTDSLPLDHLDAVTDEEGVADLAALSDGLRAEREQGITIDVAYRFFSTAPAVTSWPTRRATNATRATCSPAHPMRTCAILLVDARAGVLRQTRRHASIAKLLGIEHFVAAVNKIDLIDFDQARFAEVEAELRQMAARLGGAELTVIPIAAKHGDNVVDAPPHPVVRRPTLLEYLEGIELSAPQPETAKFRLPVQWVSRPTAQERRSYTGRLAAGTLTRRRSVCRCPSGSRRRSPPWTPSTTPAPSPSRRCRSPSSLPTTSTSAAATSCQRSRRRRAAGAGPRTRCDGVLVRRDAAAGR